MFWHHHEHAHHRRASESPDSYLSSLLEKGLTIADLGCGDGFYCQYLQKYANKLYCVDVDCSVLEEAKKKVTISNAEFLCEDAAKTSIPSESVDVAFLANAFHDMDKEEVVKEIKRILKKGGKVIIIEWEKKNTFFGPPLFIRISEEEVLNFFKDFKLINKFKPSEHHYGLVLMKSD